MHAKSHRESPQTQAACPDDDQRNTRRFWASHRAAEALEEARLMGREAKREEWRKARVAAGIVASSEESVHEAEYGDELMEGGEGWRRGQRLREECVCWWLLLEEEVGC